MKLLLLSNGSNNSSCSRQMLLLFRLLLLLELLLDLLLMILNSQRLGLINKIWLKLLKLLPRCVQLLLKLQKLLLRFLQPLMCDGVLLGPILHIRWQSEKGEGVLNVLTLGLLLSRWVKERVAWRV